MHEFLSYPGNGVPLASLIAGLFFTSFFTTAPAIVMLGQLAQESNPFLVAVLGAFGAVAGDYVLFWFVRHRIAHDASVLMKGPRWKWFLHVLHRRYFRRVLPVIGALVIASPLPDELGLALLGISSIKTRAFFLVSYFMNALGILIIGLIARSLA